MNSDYGSLKFSFVDKKTYLQILSLQYWNSSSSIYIRKQETCDGKKKLFYFSNPNENAPKEKV